MTYFESAAEITISAERALKELARHGLAEEAPAFFADMGERDEYQAQAVLEWLGY